MNDKKNTTNKVSKKHKYRVSIYLGKDNYELLNAISKCLDIPLSSATRVILETGLTLATIKNRGEHNG